jgi:hypothetical protein
MSVIRWRSFAWNANAGLCGTCIWGTVRKGFRRKEKEVFCRMIHPSALVPFEVRECTSYTDRRVPAEEPKPEVRPIGFVTEIRLDEVRSESKQKTETE